jgi:hypothetical protein
MSKYKKMGYTPGGIEVQRDERGMHRFCRGANIIMDEAADRYCSGDVLFYIHGHDYEVSFEYTLLSEGD